MYFTHLGYMPWNGTGTTEGIAYGNPLIFHDLIHQVKNHNNSHIFMVGSFANPCLVLFQVARPNVHPGHARDAPRPGPQEAAHTGGG